MYFDNFVTYTCIITLNISFWSKYVFYMGTKNCLTMFVFLNKIVINEKRYTCIRVPSCKSILKINIHGKKSRPSLTEFCIFVYIKLNYMTSLHSEAGHRVLPLYIQHCSELVYCHLKMIFVDLPLWFIWVAWSEDGCDV